MKGLSFTRTCAEQTQKQFWRAGGRAGRTRRVEDGGANRVREVSAAEGTITTVAGTGVAGTTGDGGAATSAELNSPWALAFHAGTLYISELDGKVVRAVDMSNGHISTVAGNGTATVSGDGGPAVDAGLPLPLSLVVDANGNLLIGEQQAVRRVDALSHVITTIAGVPGTRLYGGDKGAAISASITVATGLAFDDDGNLFVAETCPGDQLGKPCGTSRIRKVVDP